MFIYQTLCEDRIIYNSFEKSITNIELSDKSLNEILSVEEDFVNHVWDWVEKHEHIIAIVYEVSILKKDFDLSYVEQNWDASWIKIIDLNDTEIQKTNILKKVIRIFNK